MLKKVNTFLDPSLVSDRNLHALNTRGFLLLNRIIPELVYLREAQLAVGADERMRAVATNRYFEENPEFKLFFENLINNELHRVEDYVRAELVIRSFHSSLEAVVRFYRKNESACVFAVEIECFPIGKINRFRIIK